MITFEPSIKMMSSYGYTLDEEMSFDSLSHLKDILKVCAFAYQYRIRTEQNEFGRTISKKIFAVHGNGELTHLGNLTLV